MGGIDKGGSCDRLALLLRQTMNLSKQDRSPSAGTQVSERKERVGQARVFGKKRGWALAFAVSFAGALAACQGCKGTNMPKPTDSPVAETPTLRLYLVSDLAGALEPCGCVKDQLGGLDHAAAFIRSESARSPNSALVASGPLFFMDPTLREERRAQEIAKAETLSAALKGLGLVAFTPGRNDWAAGQDELLGLGKASGGSILLSNVATPSKDAERGERLQVIAGLCDEHVAHSLGRRCVGVDVSPLPRRADQDRRERRRDVSDALRFAATDRGERDHDLCALLLT